MPCAKEDSQNSRLHADPSAVCCLGTTRPLQPSQIIYHQPMGTPHCVPPLVLKQNPQLNVSGLHIGLSMSLHMSQRFWLSNPKILSLTINTYSTFQLRPLVCKIKIHLPTEISTGFYITGLFVPNIFCVVKIFPGLW